MFTSTKRFSGFKEKLPYVNPVRFSFFSENLLWQLVDLFGYLLNLFGKTNLLKKQSQEKNANFTIQGCIEWALVKLKAFLS